MKYQTILSPVLLISTLATARVLKLPAAAAASEPCITFSTGESACGDATTSFGATLRPGVTITKSYTTQTSFLRSIPASVYSIGRELTMSHSSDSFCATKTVTIIVTNSRGQNGTHSTFTSGGRDVQPSTGSVPSLPGIPTSPSEPTPAECVSDSNLECIVKGGHTFTVGTASVTGGRHTETSSASESSQHGDSTAPSVFGPTPCADNSKLECINQGGIPLTIGTGITTITDMPLSAELFGSHTETGTKTGPGIIALTSSPSRSSGSPQTKTKSSTSVLITLTIGGIDYNTAPTAKAEDGRGGYNKRHVALEDGRGGYNKRVEDLEGGRGGHN